MGKGFVKLFLFLLPLNIVAQTVAKDMYGNYVSRDMYGNIISTYSLNSNGQYVEKDFQGHIKATYYVDYFGDVNRADFFGNVTAKFTTDVYGRKVELDSNGNTIATYFKDAYGKTIRRDISGTDVYSNTFIGSNYNYEPANVPVRYNEYIDPINISRVQNVLAAKQSNYDHNVQRIQNAISDIRKQINSRNFSPNIERDFCAI